METNTAQSVSQSVNDQVELFMTAAAIHSRLSGWAWIDHWSIEDIQQLIEERITSIKGVLSGRSVWLGCLSAYNSGRLAGCWVKTNGIDSEQMAIIETYVNVTSPAADSEEVEIMDRSGYPDFIGDVFELAAFEEQAQNANFQDEFDAFAALCDDEGQVLDWGDFEDRYEGPGEIDAEWIEGWYSNMGYEIPDHLVCYIDWDQMAYDRSLDTFTQVEFNGNPFIFRIC